MSISEEQFSRFLASFQTSMQEILKSTPAPASAAAPSVQNLFIPTFEQFDRTKEPFSQYRQRFDNYIAMKGITDVKLIKQYFLNSIGSTTYNEAQSIVAPKLLSAITYKDLADAIETHLCPKPNVIVEQHRFLSRIQDEKESINDYVAALRKFLLTCNFNCSCGQSVADLFLRAQFIRGLHDSSIREKLLQESSIDIKGAIEKAIAIEASRLDSREMKPAHTSSVSTDIHQVSRSRNDTRTTRASNYTRRSNFRSPVSNYRSNYRPRSKSRNRVDFKSLGIDNLCLKCGRSDHNVRDCRLRKDQLKCNSCKKTGHVSKVCITTLLQTKKPVKALEGETNQLQTDTPHEDFEINDLPFIGKIETVSETNQMITVNLFVSNVLMKDTEKYFATIKINNYPQIFEVDSGSGYTLLPESEYKQIQPAPPLRKSPLKFQTYDRGIVIPIGLVEVTAEMNNMESTELLFVVPDGFSALVGRAWIRHLCIQLEQLDIERPLNTLSIHQLSTIEDCQNQFPIIFEQRVGKIPGHKGSLQLREQAKPVFVKAREVPYALRAPVNQELDVLIRDGILTPIEKCDWGSPLVPMRKPDGRVRLCIDFKVTVNKLLVSNNYPIPKIDEVLQQLKGSTSYCKLDLYNAYLHVEMDEASAVIQTVSTHRGTFKLNRLGAGIKTAPAEFHKILHRVLKGLKGIVMYFDDILVHGKDDEECLANLVACLHRLQENNLHLNSAKCQLFQKRIQYLGFVIEGNNIRKNPKKIQAVIEAPRPSSPTAVKEFLGLVTYYSRFIPDASTITYPLRRLLSKSIQFHWSADCESAFRKLKAIIASDQVLVNYDPDLPVTVACDASPTGIAGVLSHIINGQERPVAFISRSLTPAERNYSQIDREALAIIFTVEKFYVYLIGRKFTLITDNLPLSRIFHEHAQMPAMTAARHLRYAAYLNMFDYQIKYRKSEDNKNADYLSRSPIAEQPSGTQAALDWELTCCQEQTLNQISTSNITSTEIATETKKDPESSTLLENLQNGNLPDSKYTVLDGIIFYGDRVYIPKALQSSILAELHHTHIGIVKMKQLARRYCYWPGIDSDIEKLVKSCEQCAHYQKPPAKVPIHHWDEPENNFDRIHIDFAGPRHGYQFLVVVDAKSKWPEVRIFPNAPTTESTIAALQDIFYMHGYPKTIVSDNASLFTSDKFRSYCQQHGIFQIFTAPGHPATNGLAERYVQTLKLKLNKMEKEKLPIRFLVQQILLQFRATPLLDGSTPAEKYLHRPLRLRLDAIKPNVPSPRPGSANFKARQFAIGDRVALIIQTVNNKPVWKFGIVTQKLGNLHYSIQLDEGRVLKRHIDQLRPSQVAKPPTPPSVPLCTSRNSCPHPIQPAPLPSEPIHQPTPQMEIPSPPHPSPPPAAVPEEQFSEPNRVEPAGSSRPIRARRMPLHFKDFKL